MIDYSYLTPPSKATRIKLPRTLPTTQPPTSTSKSTAETYAGSSRDPSTNLSSAKPSINSKITSRKKLPTSSTKINSSSASTMQVDFSCRR